MHLSNISSSIQTFKAGKLTEVVLHDTTLFRGVFVTLWNKDNGQTKVVLKEELGPGSEQLHYVDLADIHDVRIFYGTPKLYLVK